MRVETTKDQGLYNKPSAAVHPGALASGTLPQYNTIIMVLVYSGSRCQLRSVPQVCLDRSLPAVTALRGK